VLESAGLVRARATVAGAGAGADDAGRAKLWELEPRRLEAARRSLALISAEWDAAIDRLDRLLRLRVEDDAG
jgi:hypothetical protein